MAEDELLADYLTRFAASLTAVDAAAAAELWATPGVRIC